MTQCIYTQLNNNTTHFQNFISRHRNGHYRYGVHESGTRGYHWWCWVILMSCDLAHVYRAAVNWDNYGVEFLLSGRYHGDYCLPNAFEWDGSGRVTAGKKVKVTCNPAGGEAVYI